PGALRAGCHAVWAGVAEFRGDFFVANERARAAIALADNPADAGGAYSLLVENLTYLDIDEAERLLERAAEWTAALGITADAYIRIHWAWIAMVRHDYERAVALLSGLRLEATEYLSPLSLSPLVVAHVLRGDDAAA